LDVATRGWQCDLHAVITSTSHPQTYSLAGPAGGQSLHQAKMAVRFRLLPLPLKSKRLLAAQVCEGPDQERADMWRCGKEAMHDRATADSWW